MSDDDDRMVVDIEDSDDERTDSSSQIKSDNKYIKGCYDNLGCAAPDKPPSWRCLAPKCGKVYTTTNSRWRDGGIILVTVNNQRSFCFVHIRL